MDADTLPPEVLEAAQRQADADKELLAQLQARTAELDAAKQEAMTIVTDHEVDEDDVPVRRPTMNRAQRRQQVRFYAQLLAETEKQAPYVNPTIIPRASRRRRKGGRHA